MGAGSQGPTAVTSVGGRFFTDDETETPDTLEAVLLPQPAGQLQSSTDTPAGIRTPGDTSVASSRDRGVARDQAPRTKCGAKGKKIDDFPRPDRTIPDSPGHLREWLDAIKSRNLETTCNVHGYRLTKPGLLSNISYRTGQRLRWDDETERVIDNNDANRYLSRKFRKAYKL